MSIKKPSGAPNLGPRPDRARARVSETFQTASGSQTKLTHRIDEDLHRRFKRVAVDQGRPMGDILNELIRAYTDEHDR